ncbi:hypothetical protein ACK32Z_05515 [Aeromonas hydrophila]|uniref:hypothetical protein n=1 Tax=Aeromonas hydrophila TaxID=644 RepID=UPI003987BDA7
MIFHDWQQISSQKNLVTTLRSLGIEISRTGDVPALSVLSLMDRAAFVLSLLSERNELRTLIRGDSLPDEQTAIIQGEIDAIEDSMLMISQEQIAVEKINVLQFPLTRRRTT